MYEYKSQLELFKGLIPAMNVKIKLLKKNNYNNIGYEDIWNYLRDSKWKNSVDLTLADMVQDIIHVDNRELVSGIRDRNNVKEGIE